LRPDQGDLLQQVATVLGASAARVAKNAYDYLSSVRAQPVLEVQDTLAKLDLASISLRDPKTPVEAALAISAAAVLDVGRARRLTGVERIDAALELLDQRLSAGW
jgi:hypothetical protein